MDNKIVTGIVRPVTGAVSSGMVKRENLESSSLTADADSTTMPANEIAASNEQTIKQLEKAIRAIQGPEKTFEISVHEQTHAIMVKVFNKQTGDLIREIPPEKLLDVAASIMELNGLIVDEKI